MKRRSTSSAHSLKSTRRTRYFNWRAATSMQSLVVNNKLWSVISPRARCRSRMWSVTPRVGGATGSCDGGTQGGLGAGGAGRKDEGVSMKRSWTALAVALVAIFVGAGCNDYGNTFQSNTGALVSFLSPAQISAGNVDFTLTVNGQGFVLKTVVQWNGKPLATTVPVDRTRAALGNIVTATVPAALVTKPCLATIITLNPATGAGQNGLSNPIAFIITPPPNPLPVLTNIAPNSKVVCSPDFTLTLNGSGFLPASDPSGGSQLNR